MVRFGLPGYVGSFQSVDAVCYPRASRVICRTARGLEVGEVLQSVARGPATDGALLRGMTIEDDLLLARLDRDRDEAYRECCRLLDERRIEAVLMDVEQLFDGESLFFYFLGDVSPQLDEVLEPLAERYAARIQFHQFAESLAHGCGPDCGTESATGGCSDGGCASCAVSAACRQP